MSGTQPQDRRAELTARIARSEDALHAVVVRWLDPVRVPSDLTLRQVQVRREQGLESNLGGYLLNDFEPVLFERYPQLADMARRMTAAGVDRPVLCGSGSAMAGFCEHAFHRKKALYEAFREEDYTLFWVHTHPDGAVQYDPVPSFPS